MKENKIIRYLIIIYWTFFVALSVIDKIIPNVYSFWVGVDFYSLFVKLFASLGLSNPMFATIALVGISTLEIFVLVLFSFSLFNLYKGKEKLSEQWFYRGIAFYVLLFSLFSIGDQVFGDRSNLLEHGIFFIMLIVSWVVFKYNTQIEERVTKFSFSKDIIIGLLVGVFLTIITSYSIVIFSESTFLNKNQPVEGKEVVQDVYKFDFPFLSDKFVLENTIKAFEEKHPELKINYVYTAPGELNTKKKTHMLLYVFTEQKK